METNVIGILIVAFMLFLMVMGVPIAFAMAAAGIVGMLFVAGLTATLSQITLLFWYLGTDFVLICIPLFILMGEIVSQSGIATELYDALQKWLGRLPGGLAIASVGACGAFGAVTGSSIACVATMGSIIMPELRRQKYDNKLATGVLSASGTLGILIPPSLPFVFYGIITDTSIADLFIAGIVPGIITIMIFSAIIYIKCMLNPALGPVGPSYRWKDKFKSLTYIWPVLSIFLLVVGGLYGGIFTPTEASGIGCAGVFVASVIQKRLTWKGFKHAVDNTGRVSSMVFLIIIGGYLIARFLTITDISNDIIAYIESLKLSNYMLIVLLVILYLILGCILDVYGMLILTLPLVFPIIQKAGIDPIWFGVFIVIMTEVALITPPVGVNVYVMASIAKDVPMKTIFAGVIPFVWGELLIVAILTIFPGIPLWLIRLIK
jgi:C4-dicarboxylate transporter DctM subunit